VRFEAFRVLTPKLASVPGSSWSKESWSPLIEIPALHGLNGTRSRLQLVAFFQKIIGLPSACIGACLTVKFKS
jgi:hypothetical protein